MKEYDNIKTMHNSLNLATSFLLSLHSLQTLFSPSGVGYVSTEEWKQIPPITSTTHQLEAQCTSAIIPHMLNTVLNDY